MKKILPLIAALLLSVTVQAQCYPDRHSTTWYDGWVSCETSIGPIESYGPSHWIQYDLGYTYLLTTLDVWNVNDPDHLNRGTQTMHVDISIDGVEWISMGDLTLSQGNGTSIYQGEPDLLDFDGAGARYVLFTVVDTYGAGNCAGIAEIKIGVEGIISNVNEYVTANACFEAEIYPNPSSDVFTARLSSTCNELMQVDLRDALGRVVEQYSLGASSAERNLQIGSSELPAGVYQLIVRQGDAIGRYQLVRTD